MRRKRRSEQPEEYYRQTYRDWRDALAKDRQRGHRDNYYERTYRSWRREVDSDRLEHRPEDYYERTYWAWRLGRQIKRRYVSRPWRIAGDIALLSVLIWIIVTVGVRAGIFRDAGKVPRSMDEALDSPYMRQLKEEMERERVEMETSILKQATP